MRTSWVLLLSLSILSLLITPSTGLFRPRLATPVRVPLGHHTSSLPSEPVYLNDYSTPEAAQAASRVHLPSASPFISEQYAGYVTVNKTCGSNMFWWFFGAQDGNASAPLLMWLNGGPGSSSLYGLFEEMGPFTASPDGQSVLPRNTTWNAHYAMLFVDNPVGTGFSYTEDPSCYAENMDDVAVNLYALLTGFFTAFPAYLSNPFYVCGESYGGKYAPSIAYYIHDQNLRNPPIRINLAGMSVGDGLMDPLTQIPGYGQLLFNEGMASRAELAYWEDREAAIVQALRAGQNDTAFAIFDYMLNGDFYAFPTYYRNTTGLTDYFNIVSSSSTRAYHSNSRAFPRQPLVLRLTLPESPLLWVCACASRTNPRMCRVRSTSSLTSTPLARPSTWVRTPSGPTIAASSWR